MSDHVDGDASAPDASGEQPPLGNIRVLPSQPLWDCIAAWMQPYERADGYCPRCGMNRTGRVCDGCMGDLDAILRETGPRWMRPPTPPADAPLPGPVADAVGALRNLGGAFDDEEYDAVADALAAFWRTQQQPALGDDVREVMREAAGMLDDLNRETPPNGWDYAGSAGGWRVSGVPVKVMAARLRELAGEP